MNIFKLGLSFTMYMLYMTTRRLQRRSLRLPTRSKSAQTGHLCTTVQAGAVQAFSYVGQNFLVLKWGGGLD